MQHVAVVSTACHYTGHDVVEYNSTVKLVALRLYLVLTYMVKSKVRDKNRQRHTSRYISVCISFMNGMSHITVCDVL